MGSYLTLENVNDSVGEEFYCLSKFQLKVLSDESGLLLKNPHKLYFKPEFPFYPPTAQSTKGEETLKKVEK